MLSNEPVTKIDPRFTIALAQITLPAGVTIRAWTAADFPAIQRISSNEGWTSPTQRPVESLLAWQNLWPALVAVVDEEIIGFVCGLTDGASVCISRLWSVWSRRHEACVHISPQFAR